MPDSARLRDVAPTRLVARPAHMFPLAKLLADHGSLLVMDTASARAQVGWFRAGAKAIWAHGGTEAGSGLFECLERLDVDVPAVAAFAYCEGPGSILGIRTAAMAIRAWQALAPRPAYAFRSLDLVARTLGRKGVRIAADARRNTWHVIDVDPEGAVGELQRVPTETLLGPLITPEGFRAWTAPPGTLEETSYDVERLLSAGSHQSLFRPSPLPDALMQEPATYVTWTPHVHRAPASS